MIVEFLTELHKEGTISQIVAFWSIKIFLAFLLAYGCFEDEDFFTPKAQVYTLMAGVVSFLSMVFTFSETAQFISFYWKLFT